MTTISINLDDALAKEFQALARGPGDAAELAAKVVQDYVARMRLRSSLDEKALEQLYLELADDDVALAEAGIGDYRAGLEGVDRG